MATHLKTFWFSILFLFIITQATAQKVAVVLSGGGAKGAAHVGLLKALEENNVPIDYIAGTSMGAIVGSFYAAGYSPEQIEKILVSDEFLRWAKGSIEEKYLYFFKKDDEDAAWINFKFNYDSILEYKLPTNIIAPFQVDFGFLYFLASAGAAANNNFDSLYIPFRCVAADIADKKSITFSSGYLPEAVRASMTYPFYFKPIKIDNKLLFDGGMYNNFPSDVALHDFNPDAIIGCNVSGNIKLPDESDIFSQIASMLTTNTNYNIPIENGVMVSPEVKDVSTFDFSKTKELIDIGYKATLDKMAEIKKIIKDTITKEERNTKRQAFINKKPVLVFDSIIIEGVNNSQSIYIKKSLLQRDSVLNIEKFKSQYFRLLGDDKVESIYPKAMYNQGTKKFLLSLNVKRDRNFVAQFGGIISSSNINGAYLGIQYKYLGLLGVKVSVTTHIGRFYTSLQGKSRFDFPFKIPFFLDVSFGYNKWDYFKTTTRFLEEKLPSYLLKDELNFVWDFGFPAGQKGKLLFGPSMGRIRDNYYQTNSFSKTDTADISTFDFFSAHTSYGLHSLNQKQYPMSGSSFLVDIKYIVGKEKNLPGSTSLSNEAFQKVRHWLYVKVNFSKFFTSRSIYKFGIYAEGVISNKPLFNNYTSSLLSAPAFEPTPESKVFFLPNFRANNYMAFGIKNIISIYKKIHFRLEGYIFQPYQEILKNENYEAHYSKIFQYRSLLGYAAIVYNSPICPVSLSVSYYHQRSNPISIMFNIGYIIFNRKALD